MGSETFRENLAGSAAYRFTMASMRRFLAIGILFTASVSAAAVRADAPASAKPAVPFIEDDYPRALEQARSRNLPIFVENWAPW